ncbi:MAG: alanyl-tRNA editing protein [Candidatus Hermodarchaeota archaeon]|nr:alanyl-tRNA editing protein [Candidatus Hermodarchaeota archaeon]
MPKTDLLFLEDSYLREAATTVVEVHETAVVLAATIFYPEGGGQPTDTGRLDTPAGTAVVTQVAKEGNRILHYLEGPIPKVGDEVFMRLNWERRYAFMRMHTAQHIVSRVVFDQFGALTVGNQIREEYSHIDFSPTTFQSTDLPQIEKAANDIIARNLPVVIEIIPRSEIASRMGPDRADLTKLPSSIKQVRLVQIADRDAYPCAGTHVSATGELEGIRITKRKSKGKGTIRITYELEPQLP